MNNKNGYYGCNCSLFHVTTEINIFLREFPHHFASTFRNTALSLKALRCALSAMISYFAMALKKKLEKQFEGHLKYAHCISKL